MAYTEPTNRSTGYGVTANDWNVFVENDKDFNGRISSLEDNQGTRGSNGNIYGEINSIKAINTNQNSRLTTLESEMDAVESKNTDQDTWMTTHLDGVSLADSSHATINNRLSALESGGGGGGSGAPAFFKGWISGESVSISGGWNMPFSGSGFTYVQQGGFTVSGTQVFLPSDGIYLVVCQAVFNSVSSGSGTFGLYATLNGESGAGNSLCAQEVQYNGNTAFAAAQISATSALAGSDYLSYRLYTGTTRTVRGMAYVDNQNRSVPYGGTFITITRLGGIV